jgi:8-oxo-dGTP pyrophosphatase MutT (NUDIX family)
MSVVIKNKKIPIKFKYAELEVLMPKILEFRPFLNWQQRLNEADHIQNIQEILIQDVDFFGQRIGFLKFKVDMRWEDGSNLPGIVFSRGDSVAVFLVIEAEDEEWVVLVQQPRVPVGSMAFLELPAGMIDDSESFVGVAAQELKEECGIVIKEQDLTFLTRVAPSPGGCDEFVSIYKAKVTMSKQEADSLQGKLGGLHDHGERIMLKLARKEELYESQSMTVLAALCLHERA